MKKIIFNCLALGALAMAFSACDSKNDPIDNMAFINEATSEPATEIVLGKQGDVSSTKISIRMAQKATVDTKVKLALDAKALDSYNHRNDVEYQMIPEEYIEFPAEVVIPAGSASVDADVKVTSFEGEKGVDYAAPIAIVNAEGTGISQGSGSFIITFGKFLTQMAPKFFYNNAMTKVWDAAVELPNLTLEWWVRVENRYGTGGFTINNQALFTFDSNYELYVRFGDIVYSNPQGRNLYNFLQIKTMGIDANYDSGDPNKNPLPWGEWIHFAHTYDAATGEVVLYQNGVEVNRNNGGAGKIFNISGLTICGAGSTYHRDYIEMCQVRMWKTTRTAAQIAKFMKKEVKYTDPNLLFYLPMNEGSGSILNDVTGNGYDMEIGSANANYNKDAVAWTEYTFE